MEHRIQQQNKEPNSTEEQGTRNSQLQRTSHQIRSVGIVSPTDQQGTRNNQLHRTNLPYR